MLFARRIALLMLLLIQPFQGWAAVACAAMNDDGAKPAIGHHCCVDRKTHDTGCDRQDTAAETDTDAAATPAPVAGDSCPCASAISIFSPAPLLPAIESAPVPLFPHFAAAPPLADLTPPFRPPIHS